MTKPLSDDESDRNYRPTAADRERPAPARTDRHGRDWTKGWIPISAVVSVIAFVALAVWWYAAERAADHAAIVDAKAQAVAAQAQAAAAQAALAELAKAAQASAAAQASEIAQLRISQAVTETTLVAIRAQLDRIEIRLQKGDR